MVMTMLFNYLFLFFVGSVFGYFLELIYRKLVMKKWIKPGVFKGIYLPLYGLGLVICYFVYNLNICFIFKLLLLVMLLTVIELICGVIFIKYFNIPLWDYSDNFLNFKGLICLKFSLYWLLIGLFSFLMFSFININVFNNLISLIFVIIFLVVLSIDALFTFNKLIKKRIKY